MPYPGEYPNPLQRVTNVSEVIVSGYVTTRLRVQEGNFLSSVSGKANDKVQVHVENTGADSVGFQIKQTNDITATGTRSNIGPAISLVPGGQQSFEIVPWMQFLEVHGTDSGQLRMQIAGRQRWNEMAFDKSDPFYAPELFNHAPID